MIHPQSLRWKSQVITQHTYEGKTHFCSLQITFRPAMKSTNALSLQNAHAYLTGSKLISAGFIPKRNN